MHIRTVSFFNAIISHILKYNILTQCEQEYNCLINLANINAHHDMLYYFISDILFICKTVLDAILYIIQVHFI